MSERIIDMPDECLHSWQDIYCPDERDEPMPVRERVVRCMDCAWCMAYSNATYCDRFAHELPTVEPDGFCAWSERKEAAR